jgi:type VI secretion system secreted protein VgrG
MAEGVSHSAEEKATQDNRILKLTTPLGKDVLLIDSISGTESISNLFSFQIDACQDDPPKTIKSSDILGKTVSVEVVQTDGTTRHIHGMVSRFAVGGRDHRFTHYRMEVVPRLWLLTQSKQSRIFQQMSAHDILRKVLDGIDHNFELQRTYQLRNYCVQYRESDFAFASRIMEEEGIYYFFEHTASGHKMIIADKPDSHRLCPSKSSIDFVEKITGESHTPVVTEWSMEYQLQTGRVEFRDHQFQLPNKKLEAEQDSRFNDMGNQNVEVYDFPGGYARKFDGIDKGGGDQADELQKVFQDNKQAVQNVIDARWTQSTRPIAAGAIVHRSPPDINSRSVISRKRTTTGNMR